MPTTRSSSQTQCVDPSAELLTSLRATYERPLARLLLRHFDWIDIPAAIDAILRDAATAELLGASEPTLKLVLTSYHTFCHAVSDSPGQLFYAIPKKPPCKSGAAVTSFAMLG